MAGAEAAEAIDAGEYNWSQRRQLSSKLSLEIPLGKPTLRDIQTPNAGKKEAAY